jgi:hypothetical protein
MSWPSPQDYNEAIQSPGACFADEELKAGTIALNRLGLPLVASGSFASVYRMDCHPKSWAVRCFLRHVPDQAARYAEISECLGRHQLGFTVPFRYLENGIRVQGTCYPVLKMRWAEGRTLDHVIEEYLKDGQALSALAELFKTACAQLMAHGIAHGDLQHGNIIVTASGAICLVDYDGMFVPALASLGSRELGHKNYQHPGRAQRHFGPYLDNFSAWVIYTCLYALSNTPEYWSALGGGDDCLLFKRRDFEQPQRSLSFAILESSLDTTTAKLARTVRYFLSLPIEEVPPLGAEVQAPVDMPAVLPVEQIKEMLAQEAADHQHHQRGQQERYADAADASARLSLRKPTATPAPVKVHSLPVLIEEVMHENPTRGLTADEIEYDAPVNSSSQPIGTGSTALDLLLADRQAEDLHSNQFYGTPGQPNPPNPSVVLRILLLIWILFMVAVQILQHH